MADAPFADGPGTAGAGTTPGEPLRLRAEDPEDLAVISACLQDALVPVRDLAYDRDGRSFLLVANRFRWERREADGRAYERVLCGVTFDAIDGVTYRGFRRNEEDRILALLAIRATGASPTLAIEFEFAAGAAIRLSTAAITCRAHDFGEPWPTPWQPNHEADAPE